jgi:hypothetical protein
VHLVTAAASAVSATATAISTAAATFSAATTATAAIAAATTAASATTFALFHGTRFVDGQGPTVDFLAVELRDSGLRFIGSSHFDETEAAGAAGYAIVDHLDPRDVARLGKEIGQVVFRHAKGQIAHIEFYAHFFLSGMAR